MPTVAAIATYAALFFNAAVGGELYSLAEFDVLLHYDIRARVAELRDTPHLRDLDRFGPVGIRLDLVQSRIRYWWKLYELASHTQALRLHHAAEAAVYAKYAEKTVWALRELEDATRDFWWIESRRKALSEFRRVCPWHYENGVLP